MSSIETFSVVECPDLTRSNFMSIKSRQDIRREEEGRWRRGGRRTE
jgi:hypothetical protein